MSIELELQWLASPGKCSCHMNELCAHEMIRSPLARVFAAPWLLVAMAGYTVKMVT